VEGHVEGHQTKEPSVRRQPTKFLVKKDVPPKHAHSNKKASDRNDGKENLRLLFTVHDAVKVACFEGGAWGVYCRRPRLLGRRSRGGAVLKIMREFSSSTKSENSYVQVGNLGLRTSDHVWKDAHD